MRLRSLTLQHFRNYTHLSELAFSPHRNLLIGQNGQGKTNLLEAVSVLSQTRSPRTSSDRELIQSGQPFATMTALIDSAYSDSQIRLDVQLIIDDHTQRLKSIFKINGSPVKSRSAFLGYLPTVSFFVSDLLLLRGTPEDRRRWLDAAIIQYDKRHLNYLSDFQRIKTQKNKLLKEALEKESPIAPDHLAVWNAQFAKAAGILVSSRLTYLSMVKELALINYAELSAAQEVLSVGYSSRTLSRNTETSHQPQSAEALEQLYLAHLSDRQMEECRRGACLIGPHRDDFIFELGSLDATAYGSQGQQRTVVLALKLAELKLLSTKLQSPPLLLLDDVMAELDPGRQGYLLDHIEANQQVILTTTHVDASWQARLMGSDQRVMRVEQGQVSEAQSQPMPVLIESV